MKKLTIEREQWEVRGALIWIRGLILAILVGTSALIGCGNESRTGPNLPPSSPQATVQPAVLADEADAILKSDMTDHQQRTQALFLYRQVLDRTSESNSQDLKLRARANLGIGLINFYDLFDILPTLLNLLGIDLTGLLGGISSGKGPANFLYSGLQMNHGGAALSAWGKRSNRAGCADVVNFSSYLPGLDMIVSNLVTPAIDNFGKAIAEDPTVSLEIENGLIILVKDKPLTPQDETLALDLSGRWDAGEIGVMNGVLQVLLGALKIMFSYDGLLQTVVNPAFNPGCSPPTGSAEWVALFGPYGILDANGGSDRMTEAGQLLEGGFASLGAAFAFIAARTGDQSGNVIRYSDVGTDGVGPGDPSYTAPDADGSEGNGKYDPGEPWGAPSLGNLLNGLLGSLPVDLGQLSQALTLPTLSNLMNDLALSEKNGAPVDLIQSLLRPLIQALGPGITLSDQSLYSLGLPALNLSAPFNPPWQTISMLSPLADANGATIVEVETDETGDVSHTWPAPYTRIDPPNGVIDLKYYFYPDLDESGKTVGVFGGLLLFPVTTPDDFDENGDLIGTVDYRPMVNPEFDAVLTIFTQLLGAL